MKNSFILLFLILIVALPACSGGKGNPMVPQAKPDSENLQNGVIPVEASDVLYNRASNGLDGYKAFGVYHVRLDPSTLQAEIIPARNAEAIGHTFDADLTQFLIKAPCYNCLQIGGIQYLGNDQVQIGFSVRHPFPNLASRPDLHGFDVRGIVLSDGNFNFAHVLVAIASTNLAPARANVGLMANPDGYTHHFDELAEDTHYFDPPRNYDANINPFKRFFVNPLTTPFDPLNPAGHNVMATGATWETQNYIFNIPEGGEGIEFAFVVDCAYGQSATFQNRTSPYYFLPEFNRKEAWKVDVTIPSNNLKSGNTSSSAEIRVAVCDWQAGLTADPNFPDTTNLDGIKTESDVKSVELEIPSVCGLVQQTTPASGNGSNATPYIYNLTATNTLGAGARTFYGIVAVRDDLQGTQGPMAIPASPNTFAGPEIVDYSAYQIFPIRVGGSPPTVNSITVPSPVYENTTIDLSANVTEPNGDQISFLWEQVSPTTPLGLFVDPGVRNAKFILPNLFDVPQAGIEFTLRLTATDVDGSNSKDATFYVLEYNHPPVCTGIDTTPYSGVAQVGDEITFSAKGTDPDNDNLIYEWDYNYVGIIFDVEATGQIVVKSWDKPGFYNVACRVSEDRTNALSSICQRTIIVEGYYDADIKIDNSSAADPDFYQPSIAFANNSYHAVWLSKANYDIIYGNTVDDHDTFGNYFTIANKPTTGDNRNPKICGSMSTIIIAWVEYNTSVNPYVWNLKVRRSLDGGDTWNAPVVIATVDSPGAFDDIAMSKGLGLGQFFIFYEQKEASGDIKNFIIISQDGGNNWLPFGGGQFRDVFGVGDFVSNLSLGMTIHVPEGAIIYAYWLDGQVTPARFLMDWTTMKDPAWHTDTVVMTTTDQFIDGAITTDMRGNAYFVGLTDQSNFTVKKAVFTTAPQVSQIYSVGTTGISNIDIIASSDGKIIMLPEAGTSGIRIFYTADSGITWGTTPYRIDHTTGSVYDVVTCANWGQSPNRGELLLGWVDNRGGAGQQAHIYGNYVYTAE